jgi:hypothetical protein
MWGNIRRLGERLCSLVLGRQSVATKSCSGQQSRQDDPLERLGEVVTAAAFWVAIPLPFLYLPVLFSGLKTRADVLVFGFLLAAHVAVLSVGHPYATDRANASDGASSPETRETAD